MYFTCIYDKGNALDIPVRKTCLSELNGWLKESELLTDC